MDVIEAIHSRRSVRAFKPDPVPKEVLQAIMEAALRSPSWENTQPWEFAVLGGEAMKNVKEALAASYPADRATGFREGDLRGWFWIEVPAAGSYQLTIRAASEYSDVEPQARAASCRPPGWLWTPHMPPECVCASAWPW